MLINKLMLNFKEWYTTEEKHAVVNPEVKKWVDSAEKLKLTVEKLKAILKDKKVDVDKIFDKKPVEKPEDKNKKPEIKKIEKPTDKKPEPTDKKIAIKPEKKPEEKAQELPPKIKFPQKSTKIEKDDEKGLNGNGKRH